LIGLYKTECVAVDGPFRGVADLELATCDWVRWSRYAGDPSGFWLDGTEPRRRLPGKTESRTRRHPPDPLPRAPRQVSHGNVSLRIGGALHHIGLGRHLHGTPIIMLINDLDIRVVNATTGEIIHQLTLDPDRRYHGTGRPIGGPRRPHRPRKAKPAES